MSEQHGTISDSNRGTGKQRRIGVPHITLLIPNRRARHRAKANDRVWKWELYYWQHRWYVAGRPRYRQIMQKLGLRK